MFNMLQESVVWHYWLQSFYQCRTRLKRPWHSKSRFVKKHFSSCLNTNSNYKREETNHVIGALKRLNLILKILIHWPYPMLVPLLFKFLTFLAWMEKPFWFAIENKDRQNACDRSEIVWSKKRIAKIWENPRPRSKKLFSNVPYVCC